jgi:hypothetical protein
MMPKPNWTNESKFSVASWGIADIEGLKMSCDSLASHGWYAYIALKAKNGDREAIAVCSAMCLEATNPDGTVWYSHKEAGNDS